MCTRERKILSNLHFENTQKFRFPILQILSSMTESQPSLRMQFLKTHAGLLDAFDDATDVITRQSTGLIEDDTSFRLLWTQLASTTRQRGDSAQNGIAHVDLSDGHVETLETLDEDIHDSGCNFSNVGVLRERRGQTDCLKRWAGLFNLHQD